MRPTELIVRNYRSFAGEHRIELRPLTLLFGDNSSGKSALARVLPLLADATGPYAKGPLPLESPAMVGCGFSDLRFKGRLDDEDGAHLGLGLGWGPKSQVRSAVFEFGREYRRVQVRRFNLTSAAGICHELAWIPRDETPPRYDHEGEELVLSFGGIVPSVVTTTDDVLGADIQALGTQLRDLHRKVQWIEATRAATQRHTRQPAQPFALMEADGRDAAQLVFADAAVRARVSSWFERTLDRELVVTETPPDEFRTSLRRLHDPRYDVDLLDAGQGAIQVFPVLVALAALERDDGPEVLVIEEPESHLHAEMQYQLATEISAMARDSSRAIVVETHSRALFLGVQLELAAGRLRPEDVIVHSIRHDSKTGRSYADRVELSEDGTPDRHWPPEFFSVDTHLARKVLATRQAKGAHR